MGTVLALPNHATAAHRQAKQAHDEEQIERSISAQAEHEALAQRAAEEHLAACQEAMYATEGIDDPQDWPESPSIGPFCGCDTCVVRETLHAAWPHVIDAAKEAIAREAG